MKFYIIPVVILFSGCALLKGDKTTTDKISIDLTELTTDGQKKLNSNFDIQELNIQRGEVSMTKTSFNNTVQHFIERAVLNPEIKSLDFYLHQSRPRLRYWEHIVNQLPDFVDYGYKYDSYTSTDKDKDKYLAYLVYRLDRNPENLLKVWHASKNLFFAAVNKDKYEVYQFEDYVETLLASYEHISKLENYDGHMNEIYTQVLEEDEIEDIFGRTSNQYPIYEGIIEPEILQKYQGANGMVLNDYGTYTDVLWFHSFWVRRYHEGNIEAVLQILNELDAHYKNL